MTLEYPLEILFRNARTRIFDSDTALSDGDHNLAFRCIAHCISNQVAHGYGNYRFRCDNAQPFLFLDTKHQRFVTNQRFVKVHDLVDDAADIVSGAVLVYALFCP